MPTSVPSQLLTAEDVARRLNIKVSTVYDAVARGRLPAVRLWKGARRTLLRFRESDIESVILDRTVGMPICGAK
jgi:excisionase family DNA binding protein